MNPADSPPLLLPHQRALLEMFFNPESKRVILLRGDVGLGKSVALVALSGRLLHERPSALVLFVAPPAMCPYLEERLSDAAVQSILVDRYVFRERLDSAASGALWPSGVVVVLSRDFAKQPDVEASLAGVPWDLLVVDEADWFTGARQEILRRIGASAHRLVLATAKDVPGPASVFAEEETVVVEWRSHQLVGSSGALLDALPPHLHEVRFRLAPVESRLLSTIGRRERTVSDSDTPLQAYLSMLVLRGVQSSPAALERMLQSSREGPVPQGGLDIPAESPDDVPQVEALDATSARSLRPTVTNEFFELVNRNLQEIDTTGTDSKLEALRGLLRRLRTAKFPSGTICVLTHFASTLYYLAAEIEALGMPCRLLHGGMSTEERGRSISALQGVGGVLVSTVAGLTQASVLHGVTDLVLYDIPTSKVELQQVMARFDPFGRRTRLNVHVFSPSNDTEGLLTEPLELIRDVFLRPKALDSSRRP